MFLTMLITLEMLKKPKIKNPLIKKLYSKKFKPKIVKPKKGKGSFKRKKT